MELKDKKMSLSLIQTVEVGPSGTSGMLFSSIPQNFDDLVLLVSARSTRAGQPADLLSLRINGVTTNQSSRLIQGTGTGRSTFTLSTLQTAPATGPTATSNVFGSAEIYITRYTDSLPKLFSSSGVDTNTTTAANQWLVSGIWNSTAAINSIEIFSVNSGTIVEHSSASLYGITKGSGGATVS